MEFLAIFTPLSCYACRQPGPVSGACPARTANRISLQGLNPCPAKAPNHIPSKRLNPCPAKAANHIPSKGLNPCPVKAANHILFQVLNPCLAKAANHISFQGLNPCPARAANHIPFQGPNPIDGGAILKQHCVDFYSSHASFRPPLTPVGKRPTQHCKYDLKSPGFKFRILECVKYI